MKRIVLLMMVMLVGVSTSIQGRERGLDASGLSAVISEFSGKEGFEVVRLGKLGTMAVKSIIKRAVLADGEAQDAAEVLDILRGINKLAVVDYEDCAPQVRDAFNRKIGRLLSDDNLIMEVKDEGEVMRMYGVMDEKTDKISNFVMYAPEDCALICLFGSISLGSVSSLMTK